MIRILRPADGRRRVHPLRVLDLGRERERHRQKPRQLRFLGGETGCAGAIQWQKLLGGMDVTGTEPPSSRRPTAAISSSGTRNRARAGTSPARTMAASTIWVVKLDGAGTVQWQRLLGGSGIEYGYSVQQTADGGYILLGYSSSSASGDVTGTNHGDAILGGETGRRRLDPVAEAARRQRIPIRTFRPADGRRRLHPLRILVLERERERHRHEPRQQRLWVVKLNGAGTIQWQRLLGGSG